MALAGGVVGYFGCAEHGSGGGGGGYGGAGGSASALGQFGSLPTPGGPAFGDGVSMSIDQGSGGGSGSLYRNLTPTGASGAGGAGGAGISLVATTIILNGAILADGDDGGSGIPISATNGTSAGGGGSGGGVLLDGDLTLNGIISATGGSGGSGSTLNFGSGGGGGGGRVKLFGRSAKGASFQVNLAGGAPGVFCDNCTIPGTAGEDGSFHDATTPLVIAVNIDIKPGSDPNSINLCSNGTVPIAILGSNTLDLNDIDVDSLRFAEAAVKVVGKKDPQTLCTIEDVNNDLINDLVCHYVTQDIAGIDGESTFATLNGELLDTTPIEGADGVNIVKDSC